jgi:murein DD-endopeptidase MepM/ murein hydrolase activator NlpD
MDGLGMFRKRYYILFVAREEDGRVRKIPIPLHYAYGFVAAAVIGTFTIAGLAGSYTRMLLKMESFNQVRQERETLRKNYQQMAQAVHDRDVQVASLGALANEVTALYGMRQSLTQNLTLKHGKDHVDAAAAAAAPTPATLAVAVDPSPQNVKSSIDALYALRDDAMSGRFTRSLAGGFGTGAMGDFSGLADSPSLWPVDGNVTSSFGERQDPFNGEGAFHAGVDIGAPVGTPVRATADGAVEKAGWGTGYGREINIDHGHDLMTVYGHLSSIVVIEGQHVNRGQIIGYVGQSGRSTGPHLHYEVRVHDVAVNPHKYLRMSYEQFAENFQPSTTQAASR